MATTYMSVIFLFGLVVLLFLPENQRPAVPEDVVLPVVED